MFASVTVATASLDRVDEISEIYERLLPTLEAAAGWRGVYVVVDRATGKGHLLGLWRSEADAIEFEAGGTFGRILADYPPGLLLGAPHRTVGEVVFHALRQD